jgi:internalin A
MRANILTSDETLAHFQPEVGMPDQGKPVRRPWQRYLRFSIRGLIVLVLVIGAGLGWLVRSARIQREAVAAIQKAGGFAFYDEQMRGPTQARGRSAAWLDVIRTRIDRNYFSDVVFVQNGTAASTDDELFVHISHLRRVAKLNLYWRTVTDSRFAWLRNLTSLETLMLQDVSVTGSGLAAVENMKDLRSLLIYGSRITDEGLVHLRGLDSLRTLGIGDCSISDAGMVHVARLTKLTILDLRHTDVTDTGLLHLGTLSNLSSLILSETQVTDAGLAHLRQLARLSNLDLSYTRVTDAGVNDLQRILPNLTISR